MQVYSDPSRESDPHALPDVEVWYVNANEADFNTRRKMAGLHDELECFIPYDVGHYYQFCFPGCLPDSDPVGPFATAEEAQAAAQQEC